MRRAIPLLSLAFLTLAALAALAGPPAAAQASVKFFGAPSVESRPHLSINGLPRLGASLDITLEYRSPILACPTVLTWYDIALVTGVSNRRWLGIPLPLRLGHDCNLLVSGEVIVWRPLLSTTACPPRTGNRMPLTFRLTVPNRASLIGQKAFQQIVLVARPFSYCQASNGVEMTIGR